MRLISSGDLRNSLPNQGVCDDELRFAIIIFLRAVQSVEERLHVLTANFLNVEPVSFETRRGIFTLSRRGRCIESDGIGIVNQDQVIETEMAGERARFRRNTFL